MHLFEFTRKLIDTESITENEEQVCNVLFAELETLARQHDGRIERIPVAPRRDNILACWDEPIVTFSTHMDTVPPFFPSREDEEHIWGRGACDTKGIIAAMIEAVRSMLTAGVRNLALLFVVGEERNSIGAYTAGKQGRGSKFLINGEPTENRLALGSSASL
ncbi:MAG: M20/M25/M40 family metallo-hydrolase [Bryobacteraceae bacterium]